LIELGCVGFFGFYRIFFKDELGCVGFFGFYRIFYAKYFLKSKNTEGPFSPTQKIP
jgi:hypothetical protein